MELRVQTPLVSYGSGTSDPDSAYAIVSATQVENALYSGFWPRWSSTIYGPKSHYRVLLELDPQYQVHADSLARIGFKAPSGAIVPLESVVEFNETVGPQHGEGVPAVDDEPRPPGRDSVDAFRKRRG